MKRLFTLLATVIIAVNLAPSANAFTPKCTNQPFTDVNGHYAEDYICFLYDHGIVSGVTDHSFYPDREITRAEFLKMLLLNTGYQTYSVQSASFADTKPGDWYFRYVTFAHSKGFVTGYPDNTFHPDDPISRAEAVQMLVSISGISNYDTSNANTSFYDVDGNDWYAVAVAVATESGIVEGYGDGSFRPNNHLTRADASIMVARSWSTLYE
ncbi:MAG: S-layer homology domain-containing protein [Candidatus Gracilibacteria bacterium]